MRMSLANLRDGVSQHAFGYVPLDPDDHGHDRKRG
jgi:hypothetical protein